MRRYAKTWPDRAWAVEGANGVGRPLAQRLPGATREERCVARVYLTAAHSQHHRYAAALFCRTYVSAKRRMIGQGPNRVSIPVQRCVAIAGVLTVVWRADVVRVSRCR
jgi:hypothetical protein